MRFADPLPEFTEIPVLAKYRDEAQKFYYGMLPSMEGAPPAELHPGSRKSRLLRSATFWMVPANSRKR